MNINNIVDSNKDLVIKANKNESICVQYIRCRNLLIEIDETFSGSITIDQCSIDVLVIKSITDKEIDLNRLSIILSYIKKIRIKNINQSKVTGYDIFVYRLFNVQFQITNCNLKEIALDDYKYEHCDGFISDFASNMDQYISLNNTSVEKIRIYESELYYLFIKNSHVGDIWFAYTMIHYQINQVDGSTINKIESVFGSKIYGCINIHCEDSVCEPSSFLTYRLCNKKHYPFCFYDREVPFQISDKNGPLELDKFMKKELRLTKYRGLVLGTIVDFLPFIKQAQEFSKDPINMNFIYDDNDDKFNIFASGEKVERQISSRLFVQCFIEVEVSKDVRMNWLSRGRKRVNKFKVIGIHNRYGETLDEAVIIERLKGIEYHVVKVGDIVESKFFDINNLNSGAGFAYFYDFEDLSYPTYDAGYVERTEDRNEEADYKFIEENLKIYSDKKEELFK